MPRPFRFGLQLSHPIGDTSWPESARWAEDAGFSTLFVPDHFDDQLAPFTALAVAAAATTTLRVGALVLGNDYRHPVIVAKETASLDVLSGGRVELGLGAGWMRTDYEAAGMPYERPGLRIERLEESIAVVRGLLGDGPFSFDGAHYSVTDMDGLPKPVQSPLPLLIGGGGKRMLGVAARNADIVGVTANLRSGEIGEDAIADSMPEAYDRKLEWVRDAAGDRFDDLDLSSLTMVSMVTDDREGALEGIAAMFGTTPDAVADSPATLVGSVDEIVESLQSRRERWGFNYPVLQGDDLDALAAVAGRLNGT